MQTGGVVHVACVNQDPGIAPGREKGAAVHLAAMRSAFAESGARVSCFDEANADRLEAALESVHAREPLDLVYERYALDAFAGARFAARRALAHVLEVNAPLDDEARRHRGREGVASNAAERQLFGRARLVLVVSSPLAEWTRARGARAERVLVRSNAVDARRFRPRHDRPAAERLAPPGSFVVGFHGRLRAWHGIELVARAVARLAADGLPAHLVCIGNGPFEQRCLEHLPATAFTYRPWMTHDQIARHVADFDVLALGHGSESSGECGFYFSPLKLLEAMACRVVPVVPRLGDLGEVVKHEKTGLIYEVDDLEGLVAALRRLYNEPTTRVELGRAARAAAENRSWTSLAREVLERVALPAEGGAPKP